MTGIFGEERKLASMTISRIAALIGVAMLVLVTNVAASVLYMVIYGHIIDPGHEPKYYQDHIQVAGPYCSIVAGIPIMFLAGWLVATNFGHSRSNLCLAGVHGHRPYADDVCQSEHTIVRHVDSSSSTRTLSSQQNEVAESTR